jgi:hypothetical protein
MRAWLCGLAVGLGLLTGCKDGGGEAKFIPAESNAREALEAALKKWQDGEPQPAEFPLGKVKVQVVDQVWAGGLKLQGFEIVGEEPASGGPRVFDVKLKTPKGEQATKYYVVGIDPLWVYGESDYKKMTGG